MTGPDPAGLPPGLIERARAATDPSYVPPPVRDAATIALVRNAPGGLQVYLLRRVRAMAFASGMHVFPGGSVDPADERAEVGWTGPPAHDWGQAFATSAPLARALVCAAVRETFEECGVLLAGPHSGALIEDVSDDDWEAERVALEARALSLSDLLARRALVLRADLLRPLAHWITPEVEPKRFDTRFFLAEMPAGQAARDVGGEADQRVWIRPQDALDQGLAMMPPTAAVLRDLAEHDDVSSALAVPRAITPVLPKLVVRPDDSVAMLLPGDPDYPVAAG